MTTRSGSRAYTISRSRIGSKRPAIEQGWDSERMCGTLGSPITGPGHRCSKLSGVLRRIGDERNLRVQLPHHADARPALAVVFRQLVDRAETVALVEAHCRTIGLFDLEEDAFHAAGREVADHRLKK